MSKKKNLELPTILVTNDDGITAPGIKALVEVAKHFGKVVVVAPDAPQSGMGHAITIGKPLRLNKVNQFGEDVLSYQCTGTPADCVKLAVDIVLKGQPTICVSGINHGSNASINVIYSGTMSAAMEASLEGIPSAGFSLLDYRWEADFDTAKAVATQVIEFLLTEKLERHTLFNVNIPNVSLDQLKGIKVCRQGYGKWKENFVERVDPSGKKYYWLTGEFQNMDKGTDYDLYALNKNYASLVPIDSDLTKTSTLKALSKKWSS